LKAIQRVNSFFFMGTWFAVLVNHWLGTMLRGCRTPKLPICDQAEPIAGRSCYSEAQLSEEEKAQVRARFHGYHEFSTGIPTVCHHLPSNSLSPQNFGFR
jgi:hypothetical protein